MGFNRDSSDTGIWLNSTLATLGRDINIGQANISQLTAGLININGHMLLNIVDASKELGLNQQLLSAKIKNYIQLYADCLMAILDKDTIAIERCRAEIATKQHEIFLFQNHVEVFGVRFSNTVELFNIALTQVIDHQRLFESVS